MDLKEIKKLITLMNENGLARLEVEEEGRRYLLEKALGPSPPAANNPPLAFPEVTTANPGPAAPASSGSRPVATEGTLTFNSPMVGTFFRASSPETEPFVEPGQHVTPDSVLCLIEAMKVFNEIKAEMSGTIVEVLAENQEAVEYNQPLFVIKPD